jgi:hypothetical protein
MQRLRHDTAWAAAQAICERFCLMPSEVEEAHRLVYAAVMAALTAYDDARDSERSRLARPSPN